MANNFMQISHNDRYYVINKDDSLKTLLTQEELLKLPLSVWKELFELKDGVCYFRLMLQVLEAVIKPMINLQMLILLLIIEKSIGQIRLLEQD